MGNAVRPPVWYWIVAGLLALWEAVGCIACLAQITQGAAAMGPVDDWSRAYYAALPVWYNWVYGVATFGGLLGAVALLWRKAVALRLFQLSLVAVIVMFGWAFAATDMIAHKGAGTVLPFPLFIVAVGTFAIWLAALAIRKGWIAA